MRVGTDTGGTFTDLVDETGAVAKVLSRPKDPAGALAGGLEVLGTARPDVLTHGTTIATNAVLERRGATVALVTTEGFADVIEIARQNRPSLYDPFADRPEPLVGRDRRHEVVGRLAADGTEVTPLDVSGLGEIGPADAVAVCLLHADLNGAHEQAVARELRRRGHDVTCSSDVAPEFREYERTSTTVMNAYVRPLTAAYLRALGALADEVLVMTSAGGLVPVAAAAEAPVRLLLSGPAGGVRAGAYYARVNGHPDAVTFDMGGTSTDVCLVSGGQPAPAAQRSMAGLPVRVPALDVLTIGAGGGSVARIDAGGALVVGPESAGAMPGPACYGRGGTLPTVTDANLVAGRIPTQASFSDLGTLDVKAAAEALAAGGFSAADVLAVVNANMAGALRQVTIERGTDPSEVALVAFGGAGPLHACDLADELGMPAVIVPPRAGVLSAVGILGGPRQTDVVQSWPATADHEGLAEAAAALAARARADLRHADRVAVRYDCRYRGQSHELTVDNPDDFAAEHVRRNGYSRPDTAVEVVALRASAEADSPVKLADLPPGVRQDATGPTVVVEPDTTLWVSEGWCASVGEAGAWILRRTRNGDRSPLS